jgi:hypothetical protein
MQLRGALESEMRRSDDGNSITVFNCFRIDVLKQFSTGVGFFNDFGVGEKLEKI